jgi:hypothetical protein
MLRMLDSSWCSGVVSLRRRLSLAAAPRGVGQYKGCVTARAAQNGAVVVVPQHWVVDCAPLSSSTAMASEFIDVGA